MRDTPWHARPRAPEPSLETTPTPQQNTFRRLVIVNQELAQHNAKLRQDLAEARRRAAVTANAEAQAGIVVALQRERQTEAARLRRELLTSLSEAREEIRKLKIQVDAQASLLRLQRALDTSPATQSPSGNAAPSSAGSAARREPEEETGKKNPETPPSPFPPSLAVAGVPNTLGRACFSVAKREDAIPRTMPPPATRQPRVNLRGFAARETTSPATRDETHETRRLEPARLSPQTTPRRALRHRLKHVVYTEPSLKTKMRRPRTPPRAARAPASAAVAANPFSPKKGPPPEAGSAATPDDDGAAADDAVETVSDAAAAVSEREASTTPLAFVTSRRHRRRRAGAREVDA